MIEKKINYLSVFTQDASDRARVMLSWDVNNGVRIYTDCTWRRAKCLCHRNIILRVGHCVTVFLSAVSFLVREISVKAILDPKSLVGEAAHKRSEKEIT